jgi:hypothetical protein
MPSEASDSAACDWRQEYTDEERAERQAWLEASMERMVLIMPQIPRQLARQEEQAELGRHRRVRLSGLPRRQGAVDARAHQRTSPCGLHNALLLFGVGMSCAE